MKEQIASLLSLVFSEETKMDQFLHLSAFENRISETVRRGMISSLGERYLLNSDQKVGSMVRKGEFQFRPLARIQELEEEATFQAKQMFSARYCDFRPLSGVHATLCSIGSLTEPGDRVLSIDPKDGGHFATRGLVERMGRKSGYLPWDSENFDLDYDEIRRMAKKEKVNAIILEHGIPLYPFNLAELRDIFGENTSILYDASHTLGLIAGGEFQNPLKEGANLLQGNTHKSFPGPHKGILLTHKRGTEEKLRAGLDTAFVSSQHTHHAIALYLATLEMGVYGEVYAKAMIQNARTLSMELERLGFTLHRRESEHTKSHVLLVKMDSDEEAFQACSRLYEHGISTHARKFFGKVMLRLGVQEITRHGMKAAEMKDLASLMSGILHGTLSSETIRKKRIELKQYLNDPLEYSFDAAINQESKNWHASEPLPL